MQGLPFDENDFPTPPVSSSGTWIDHSPRLISPSGPSNANTVTEEELYRIVAGQPAPPQPPPQVPGADVMRFSQQMPVMSTAAASLYVPPQMQAAFQHQQQQPRHQQSQQLHQAQMPSRVPQNQNPNSYLSANKTAAMHQQPAQMPSRRQRATTPQGATDQREGKRVKRMSPSLAGPNMHQGSRQSKQPLQQHDQRLVNTPAVVAGPSSPIFHSTEPLRKPIRSAVEEARMRAQREAEFFANSRRDSAKREANLAGSTLGSHSEGSGKEAYGDRRSSKRSRHDHDKDTDGQESRKTTSKGSASDDKTKHEDDSDAEKQERYKRRLDMNRESAAVSRVRRRAYVKELEERLAAVEAEKLQLEGKLEIMMSQNESFKKQLDNLFLMVTGGRRPPYPPPPGEGAQ